MRLKNKLIILATAVFSLSLAGSVFADTNYGWVKDSKGWWWNMPSGYPKNCWAWIDGNVDGYVECYYFGADGYALLDTTTPDGYKVNADGAWVENGVVQRRAYVGELGDLRPHLVTNNNNNNGTSPVTDASKIAKITLNTDVYKFLGMDADTIPNKSYVGDDSSGLIAYYNVPYNGGTLKIGVLKQYNEFTCVDGPAKLFFNNIPEQGIEKNAFYDSLGLEGSSTGRRAQGSTSISDEIYGKPMGTYKYAQVTNRETEKGTRQYGILLTPGPDMGGVIGIDDIWYIYPDSFVDMN